MLDLINSKSLAAFEQGGQMQCRFVWKNATGTRTPLTQGINAPLRIDEGDLANILYHVYQNMFQHENMSLLMSDLSLQRLQNNSCPRYHRGSFVAFIALVRTRVLSNWTTVMEKLLSLVENDSNLITSQNYLQELYLYLHIFKVYSVTRLKSIPERHSSGCETSEYEGDPTSFVCVSLKVPRVALSPIKEVPYLELGTPVLECTLQSSDQYPGRPWHNLFSVVQLAFGEITTSGSVQDNDLEVKVSEDEDGWMGDSPLLVSFYVPTWLLLQEPGITVVKFGIKSTPQSARTFFSLIGVQLILYQTHVGDRSNVYITKYAPNQSSPPSICSHLTTNAAPGTVDNASDVWVSALIDHERAQMTALVGRVNLKSPRARDAFRDGAKAETLQESPWVVNVIISAEFQYALEFPAPVRQSRSRLRLARKSAYVEVIAPIARPEGKDCFPTLMYPTLLDQRPPVNYNLPRLNLNCLPTLDKSESSRLQWLVTHASLMFSTRERALRDAAATTKDGIHENVRLNYKESLFALFMTFSGLQDTQSTIFVIQTPHQNMDKLIIIGSSLKLDLANHTAVLDAAVLRFQQHSDSQLMPFLNSISSLKVRMINADEDEMKLWKSTMPAYVERCREWNHTDSCEYQTRSLGKDDDLMICSCGKGRFPPKYVSGVPKWETARQHASRVAISPSFCVPYVETLCELTPNIPPRSNMEGCEGCGKSKRSDGRALLKCARCVNAKYCSAECQRAKWKDHKRDCGTKSP